MRGKGGAVVRALTSRAALMWPGIKPGVDDILSG